MAAVPSRRTCDACGREKGGGDVRLLVTGGAGYVGSVVAALLLREGHEVVVFDNLFRGFADAVPDGAEFIQGDLTDTVALSRAVTEDLDGVLHFAALSLVGESVTSPDQYWRVNVGGTQNLLDAMRSAGVPRLVFSSTAATYGSPAVSPITEDATCAPTNPYGASKLAVDHMIGSYAHAFGIGAVSLRYFNVAGAAGHIGERHDPETHLIPNILAALRHDGPAVTIFGTDWPTPDGTPIRDYIHVSDLADAHVRALKACMPGHHDIINLGTGTGYSVREVIAAVERVTGRAVPAVEGARRAGDPAVLVASSERARERLAWTPQHSLDDIVRDAWQFLQGRGA